MFEKKIWLRSTFDNCLIAGFYFLSLSQKSTRYYYYTVYFKVFVIFYIAQQALCSFYFTRLIFVMFPLSFAESGHFGFHTSWSAYTITLWFAAVFANTLLRPQTTQTKCATLSKLLSDNNYTDDMCGNWIR